MKLITGHTGEPHIYAADDAAVHKLMVGDGDYVLPYGNKFAITQTDAHAVAIADGYLMTQGRLAAVRSGEEETFDFDTGTNGYYTPFVIAAQYSNDGGVERMDLVKLQGSKSSTSTVTYPTLSTGNIDAGETHQMGLWRVVLNGKSIASMTRYTEPLVVNPVSDIYSRIGSIESDVAGAITDMNSRADTAIADVTSSAQTQIAGWKPFYFAKGDTFNAFNGNGGVCAGLLTSSGTKLYFTVPTKPIVSGSVSVNNLYMIVRLSTGGYPVVKGGSTYTALDNAEKLLWSGGVSKVTGISSVTAVNVGSGVRVDVVFSSALLRPDKKTSALNNTPIAIWVPGTTKFTVS